MFDVILKENPAYTWTQTDKFCFIGFVQDSNGDIYRQHEAIAFLNNRYLQNENYELAAKDLNGIYSFIEIKETELKIHNDIVNFFPVFYLFIHDKWMVSDDWNYLVEIKNGLEPNYNAAPGFLSAGFVLGYQTLDANILKTRAGSVVSLHLDGKITTNHDFYFLPKTFAAASYSALIDNSETALLEAGKRVIKFLNGRTAILPLSGGFDSRLIACILKKLNYTKVICFTYGRHTKEVEISKNVASILGYEWHYVNYSEIEYKGFTKNLNFIEYFKKYSNGYSMVFLQEYFAVRELVKNNKIPADSVFLPGHSGDYIGGSYVEKTANAPANVNLAEFLAKKYFFFKKPSKESNRIIVNQIEDTLKCYPEAHSRANRYNPKVEDWDIKEKLSKFIFRSSYVFTHFGFEHIFLFWDRELLEFYRTVPFEYRSEKKLYDDCATERFFKPNNVFFEKAELKRSKLYRKFQVFKDETRDYYPWSFVLRRMIKHDWLNYYAFTREMENARAIKTQKSLRRYKLFTAVICRWYLDFIGFNKKAE